MARKKPKKDEDLLDIVKRRCITTPEARAELAEARASALISRRLYALRAGAGLTQRELAERIGTKHSVISRLENDDYEGHSLTMLRRIARVFGKRVEIRFVTDPEAESA